MNVHLYKRSLSGTQKNNSINKLAKTTSFYLVSYNQYLIKTNKKLIED